MLMLMPREKAAAVLTSRGSTRERRREQQDVVEGQGVRQQLSSA